MPLETKSSKAFPQIAEQFLQQYLEAIFPITYIFVYETSSFSSLFLSPVNVHEIGAISCLSFHRILTKQITLLYCSYFLYPFKTHK